MPGQHLPGEPAFWFLKGRPCFSGQPARPRHGHAGLSTRLHYTPIISFRNGFSPGLAGERLDRVVSDTMKKPSFHARELHESWKRHVVEEEDLRRRPASRQHVIFSSFYARCRQFHAMPLSYYYTFQERHHITAAEETSKRRRPAIELSVAPRRAAAASRHY